MWPAPGSGQDAPLSRLHTLNVLGEEVAGAIGVSGGTVDQEVAEAGVAAFA
ncbi:MAG TPA: hypothetical protein VN178_11315 [Rubrobacter sp.]|nr:hypothetical protein [Rubrobacter sp.]